MLIKSGWCLQVFCIWEETSVSFQLVQRHKDCLLSACFSEHSRVSEFLKPTRFFFEANFSGHYQAHAGAFVCILVLGGILCHKHLCREAAGFILLSCTCRNNNSVIFFSREQNVDIEDTCLAVAAVLHRSFLRSTINICMGWIPACPGSLQASRLHCAALRAVRPQEKRGLLCGGPRAKALSRMWLLVTCRRRPFSSSHFIFCASAYISQQPRLWAHKGEDVESQRSWKSTRSERRMEEERGREDRGRTSCISFTGFH